MDLEDIGLRYKEVAIWKRIVAIIAISFLPGAYDFWDRWETLVQSKKTAQEEKVKQEEKLKEALEKHKKLAELEEVLAATEAEVKEASKKLPDEVIMDQFLQRTELIAQDLGLSLKLFQPREEIPSETEFKYMKLPVHVEMVGTFGQIASFLDRIVHLETIVHVENLDLSVNEEEKKSNQASSLAEFNVVNEKAEEMKRSKIRIRASADLMIFRGLTQRENEFIQSIYDQKKKEAEAAAGAVQGAPGEVPGVAPDPGAPAAAPQDPSRVQ